MPDEISIVARMSVTNGNLKLNFGGTTNKWDQASATGGNPGTVNIGTSDESISLGDVSSAGWAFFKNLDATNYVEIGPTSSGALVPFMRLEPGEEAVLRLTPSVALRGQANTAAVNVLIAVLAD